MSSETPPRHPSLEKTDSLDFKTASPEAKAALPPGERLSDTALLKDEINKKMRSCAALERSVQELKTTLEALRRDFAGQRAEHLVEVKALKDIIQRTQSRAEETEAELFGERQAQKQLKAQNLNLQYHLNLWGIPISSGTGSANGEPGRQTGVDETFFPPLVPAPGSEDPIPSTLRGELSSFYFPNLLHFLANSNLEGVLTVVNDGIVSKLYLEKGVLKFAGWNNRDPELMLATLLEESGLVEREVIEELAARPLYDLELANVLVTQKDIPAQTVRSGLKEHARVILGFLFHLKRGSFLFQPGQIQRRRELQFRLSITDILLKTAAEMDEKTRVALEK